MNHHHHRTHHHTLLCSFFHTPTVHQHTESKLKLPWCVRIMYRKHFSVMICPVWKRFGFGNSVHMRTSQKRYAISPIFYNDHANGSGWWKKIEAGPARFSLPLPKNANYYVRGDKIPGGVSRWNFLFHTKTPIGSLSYWLFEKSRRGERFPLSRGIIIVYRVLIIVHAQQNEIPGPFKKKGERGNRY